VQSLFYVELRKYRPFLSLSLYLNTRAQTSIHTAIGLDTYIRTYMSTVPTFVFPPFPRNGAITGLWVSSSILGQTCAEFPRILAKTSVSLFPGKT